MCPGSSYLVWRASSSSQILDVSGKDQFLNLVSRFTARICRRKYGREERRELEEGKDGHGCWRDHLFSIFPQAERLKSHATCL